MPSPRTIIGALIWSIALAAGSFFYGQSVQKDADTARVNHDTLAQLTAILDNSKNLAAEAVAASKAMRGLIALRTQSDALTTKDLQDALAKTAGNRVNCRFDDDVMHQLDAARNRATKAAAGGLRSTVPAANGSD
jgi:hypothetical protein